MNTPIHISSIQLSACASLRRARTRAIALAAIAVACTTAPARAANCPLNTVKVGTVCIDKYEASIWSIPATNPSGGSNAALINKVKGAKVTLSALVAGGATQVSPSPTCAGFYPASFPDTGNWTAPLYAASVAGVHPSACMTWFQAEQACRLSGGRLLTNQEWQAAAAGTPDPGTDNAMTDCNVSAAGTATDTGARTACKSSWGVFDMVGNVSEWVADWLPGSTGCPGWTTFSGGSTTSDSMCLAGGNPSMANAAALVRGGAYTTIGGDANPGVFDVIGFTGTNSGSAGIGFRCGR